MRRQRNPIFAHWWEGFLRTWHVQQTAVARLMGTAPANVSRWKPPTMSQPEPDHVRKLADVLQLPRSWLLDLAGYGAQPMTAARARVVAAAIDLEVRRREGVELAQAKQLALQWAEEDAAIQQWLPPTITPVPMVTTSDESPTTLLPDSNLLLLAEPARGGMMGERRPLREKPVPIYANLTDALTRQGGAGKVRPMPIEFRFVPVERLRTPGSPVYGWHLEGPAPPPFTDGDTVVVEETSDWRPGDWVAALVDGAMHLGTVHRNGHGFVLTAPEREPVHLDDRVDVCGRIIGRWQWMGEASAASDSAL